MQGNGTLFALNASNSTGLPLFKKKEKKKKKNTLKIKQKGRDVAQMLQRETGAGLILWYGKGFFSQSQLLVQAL